MASSVGLTLVGSILPSTGLFFPFLDVDQDDICGAGTLGQPQSCVNSEPVKRFRHPRLINKVGKPSGLYRGIGLFLNLLRGIEREAGRSYGGQPVILDPHLRTLSGLFSWVVRSGLACTSGSA